MQQVQDKEFDQLFKDTFAEAEVTPSAHLWNNIETQLEVKPKRVFPVYWLAAAVSMVAVALGLLFYTGQHQQKVGPALAVHQTDVPQADDTNQPQPEVISSAEKKSDAVAVQDDNVKKPVYAVLHASTDAAEKPVVPAAVPEAEKELSSVQPLTLNAHLVNKEIAVEQHQLGLPEQHALPENGMVLASAAGTTPERDEIINENDNKAESKGIRNVGDLINYVVDKVDKREEKVIQFQTDDDNSSLIAINIGMFKFNQKKHK